MLTAQNILSFAIVVMLAAVLSALLFHAYPEANRDLINVALGAVIAKFGTVYDFFFGSSRSDTPGTAANAAAVAAVTPPATVPPPPPPAAP